MSSFRTSKEIIREFCEKKMNTHTDWTGTRVETKDHCESVDEFVNELTKYLEDNYFRC